MSVSKALHPSSSAKSNVFITRTRKDAPRDFYDGLQLSLKQFMSSEGSTYSDLYVDACVVGDAISVGPPISDLSPRGEKSVRRFFCNFDVCWF